MAIWFWQNWLNILCAVRNYVKTFNSILQKNEALGSTLYNQSLSRKEMDIKMNAVDYKIWRIMQDRVYAHKITNIDGTQAVYLWWMRQDWSAADW